MTKILDILGLVVVPVPSPFPVQAKDKKERTPKDTPDNTVYHAGLAFVQEWDGLTVTDTRYNGQGARSAAVTNTDKRVIDRDRLDEEKYRTLKPYWAAGLSAEATAKTFRGQRGFSARTLDNYWKAFVEADPSPLKVK